MKLKHKLTSIALGILVLASPVIGVIAPVLGSGTASAASLGTFTYEPGFSNGIPAVPDGSLDITCSGAGCPGGDGSTYNYIANSKYKFDNSVNSNPSGNLLDPTGGCFIVTITVSSASKPGNGTVTDSCGHKNTAITIGNTAAFNKFISAGGSGSVGGKVTAKLSVDFGETDPSLSVGAVDLSIKCDSANKSDPVCLSLAGLSVSGPDGVSTTLATNPVVYSTSVSGFVPGHKYMLCWSGSFLKGSDGKLGDPLCTNNFTAKTTAQTVSLNGTGDNTKLSGANGAAGSSSSDPSNACESNAGGFGWVICKLIDGLQSAVGGIYDHIINPLLTVEPISTSNKTGSQIYSAWSNFR
ncbi:MAG TPA: hypothetical protein VN031_02585, partial [Candidatus Microsaccharimonas sp.]|nr:hypothetical protein [Candidatus Microsaccharimonas sp.]